MTNPESQLRKQMELTNVSITCYVKMINETDEETGE